MAYFPSLYVYISSSSPPPHHHRTPQIVFCPVHCEKVGAASAGGVVESHAFEIALAAVKVRVEGLEAALVAVLPIAAAWRGLSA